MEGIFNGKRKCLAGAMLACAPLSIVSSSSVSAVKTFSLKGGAKNSTSVKAVKVDGTKDKVKSLGTGVSVKKSGTKDSSSKKVSAKADDSDVINKNVKENLNMPGSDSNGEKKAVNNSESGDEVAGLESGLFGGNLGKDLLAGMDENTAKGLVQSMADISKMLKNSNLFQDKESLSASDSLISISANMQTSDAAGLAEAFLEAKNSGFYDVDVAKTMGGSKEALTGFFKQEATMALMDIESSVVARSSDGKIVGQGRILPDPFNSGTVKVQSWASKKDYSRSLLGLLAETVGKNDAVKKVVFSVPDESGAAYKDVVKEFCNNYCKESTPFKTLDVVERTSFMKVEKNNGHYFLKSGVVCVTNGGAPQYEQMNNIEIAEEEIGTYKQMIKTGKLASGNKDKNDSSLETRTVDYELSR